MTREYLAAYVAGTNSMSGVYLWSGVLIGLLLVAFYAYTLLTRWMKSDDVPAAGRGFSLSDMRELHRTGKMSDEEFETARARLVAAAKKMTDEMPAVLPKKQGRTASKTDAAGRATGE